MANVRNCQRCGRIFNYVTGQPICAQCRRELEDRFKDVRKYVRRNPDASIQMVSEECQVDTKQIRQWIREERLSFSNDSAVGIECERCGKSIKTGRFCKDCKAEMKNEFDGARGKQQNSEPVESRKKEEKSGSKMRFLNKDTLGK